jgi:hypothetical protein
MGPPAPGSNNKPNRRATKALERRAILTQKYVDAGMDEVAAQAKAQKEMRDNGKGDWRRG